MNVLAAVVDERVKQSWVPVEKQSIVSQALLLDVRKSLQRVGTDLLNLSSTDLFLADAYAIEDLWILRPSSKPRDGHISERASPGMGTDGGPGNARGSNAGFARDGEQSTLRSFLSITSDLNHRKMKLMREASKGLTEEGEAAAKSNCPFPCKKCGKREIYYWSVQTRSSDEAATVFYRCLACGCEYRNS